MKFGSKEREVTGLAILVVEVNGRFFDAAVECIDLGTDWMIGYTKPVIGCVVESGTGYMLLAAGKSQEEAVEHTVEFLKLWIAWRLEVGAELPGYISEAGAVVSEMTEERLAFWHQMRDRIRNSVGKTDLRAVDYEFMAAVDEIDRLRAENERLRKMLWHYAKVRLSDDQKLAQCSCSPGDQCSCAYDCDCRERYEHVYEDHPTDTVLDGWRNTGKANPEPVVS